MSSRESDINSMYKLVKKHKATLYSETEILEVDGTTYQVPDEVSLGWLHHYSSLAKPNSNSTETTYDNYIELDYAFSSDYYTKYSQMLPPTTTIDVMKAIQSINTTRSPDVDGLVGTLQTCWQLVLHQIDNTAKPHVQNPSGCYFYQKRHGLQCV